LIIKSPLKDKNSDIQDIHVIIYIDVLEGM